MSLYVDYLAHLKGALSSHRFQYRCIHPVQRLSSLQRNHLAEIAWHFGQIPPAVDSRHWRCTRPLLVNDPFRSRLPLCGGMTQDCSTAMVGQSNKRLVRFRTRWRVPFIVRRNFEAVPIFGHVLYIASNLKHSQYCHRHKDAWKEI